MPLGPRRSSVAAVRGMRSRRRSLVWATTNTNVSFGAGAARGFDLLGNLRTTGSSVLGCTVVRTHIQLGLDWVTPVKTEFWCVGVIRCRDVDVAASIDPNTNPGDDWMLSKQYFPSASGAALDIFQFREIDLRAKRKVQELEETAALMISNHGAVARNVAIYARTLVALP
jgi:hypothetical protein